MNFGIQLKSIQELAKSSTLHTNRQEADSYYAWQQINAFTLSLTVKAHSDFILQKLNEINNFVDGKIKEESD